MSNNWMVLYLSQSWMTCTKGRYYERNQKDPRLKAPDLRNIERDYKWIRSMQKSVGLK